MISIEEALTLVLAQAVPRPPQTVALADALGLVLAEDVTSGLDSPPHDKAMVDGYALCSTDLAAGHAELKILEEVTAGALPQQPVGRGCATRIMTGAPLPDGADAVVPVERTRLENPERVRIEAGPVAPGENILRRGAVLKCGDVVLWHGALVRPVEIGLLCEVGKTAIQAVPRPRLAVLATGNELVDADREPGPGQIRNSNSPMLAAAAQRAGAVPTDLGIARDEPDHLARLISVGLEHDVLLLSGGVSAGVLDLVPGVLKQLGVEQVFHKVRLKPGKPLWFGVRRADDGTRLVFGLPGNPVSSLVCFELFVRPALARLRGLERYGQGTVQARLATRFTHRGDRPTYHPAVLESSPHGPVARTVAWQGSADLRGIAAANALIMFAAGNRDYAAGEEVEALLLWPDG